MTAGIAMAVMWRIIFSGDSSGYLNSILLAMNIIETPIQWLQNPELFIKYNDYSILMVKYGDWVFSDACRVY